MTASPVCPGCGAAPLDLGVPIVASQAFCPSDDCHVLMWNPTRTLEQNAAGARTVDLLGLEG